MKKYLMTGIAALGMCFGFTSCSHEFDNLSQEEIDQMKANEIVENYKKAFIENFGQPAADQDWGFGTTATRGITRSISDMQPGANKNRNLWAATDGDFNLLVPTPLTDKQRLRVRAYFQSHPNLTWEAPTMTNYFIQQVYKGNPQTAGTLSAEQYPTGNGQTVKSSDHMNKLTVGSSNEHVLDFNNGDNPNNAKDVKDNGTLTNDTQYHSDQITLILGIQPTCVGFHVTEGNVQHNECMALAGAKVIDDWAIANEAALKAAGLFGEDVWYGTDQYGYENKSWDRSFVGLDYEQLTLAQCSTNNNVKISHFQKDWVWDGTTLWKKSDYINANGDDLIYKNNVVKYITTNTNEICGTNVDESQQTWYLTRMDASGKGGNSSEEVIDLTKVKAKLDTNCYPVENGGLQKWVKNIGGRDYVYSDWIVTLTPAKENTQTPPPSDEYSIRVIAEDLTFGKDLNTDFDFNDVVFDVALKDNETKIRLKAAGGTLPLIIGVANPQNDKEYTDNEVHKLFGVGINVMVNTKAEKKGLNGASKPDAFLTLNMTYSNAKDIPVYVKKSGTWVELTAVKGEPASKIGVGLDYVWVDERESLKGRYTKFVDWVKADANERGFIWW